MAVKDRETIGLSSLMFESDYPHADSVWPNSRVRLTQILEDVPDNDARMIAEMNARRFFRFPRST